MLFMGATDVDDSLKNGFFMFRNCLVSDDKDLTFCAISAFGSSGILITNITYNNVASYELDNLNSLIIGTYNFVANVITLFV